MIISSLLSKHTDGREKYQSIYNEFFEDDFCCSIRKILEIGIKDGTGLRAWLKTFRSAKVYGFDILPSIGSNPRLQTFIGNSTVSFDVETFFMAIDFQWMDVIVDDGDHAPEAQLATLRNFYPYLSSFGLYIMEDTGARTMDDPFVREIQAICPLAKVQTRRVDTISGVIIIQNAA